MTDLDHRLTEIRPSERQLALQQTEFYAFIHFSVNTFTNREWGDGAENPRIFCPAHFDPTQWVAAVKSAGMRGLILTCKHHDGFCLWPSRLTGYTVAASPWRGGQGDVVREVADACHAAGLKFGVYLSPWDRNQPCYGSGKPYDDFFVGQLTELLTGYGELFAVWLDGACGEGMNGRRQHYDWARYYATVRALQPNACIHVCGPDVRWCGNECGDTRESEWSVVPKRTQDTERIASDSQQHDETAFRQRRIRASDRDLGSRAILQDERELVWYPAEVNTSIRPGWFYHPEEDGQVKSADTLMRLYLKSVGGNATFLLNIPPMPDGLLHPHDTAVLAALGTRLQAMFSRNLLCGAALTASVHAPGCGIENVRTDAYSRWFQPPKGQTSCEIRISFPSEQAVSCVLLKENICMSQRIEAFSVLDGCGHLLGSGTTVGYKKILPLPCGTRTDRLTIRITDSRVCPTLAFLAVY